MSAIKTISGVPDPAQATIVEKEKQPVQESPQESSVQESLSSVPFKQTEEDRDKNVSSSSFATYEEAMEVAEKLQERVNEIADVPQRVSIRTDEEVNQYIIEIKDSQGNVVKQFPPEKVLNLHRKLDDLSGMVIDEMI